MSYDIFLQAAGIAFAAVILFFAEPAINRMSKCTNILIRISFVLMIVGAVAMIGKVLLGYIPGCESLLAYASLAVLLAIDRRNCELRRSIEGG